MAACTRCGFQQSGTQAYCEHCGMFLPALAIYNPAQPEYAVTSQIVPRPKPSILERGLTATMILDKCVREGIAIFGLLIASFGVFGALDDLPGSTSALLLGLALLVGGILFVNIRFFVQKLLPRLLWWQILVGGLSATMIGFITIMVVSATTQEHTVMRNLGFGITLFLYGLAITALAVW
ncbi:MAG: hypothetical protein NVS4B12_23420 [Ktedonobacteraceae bacterium]